VSYNYHFVEWGIATIDEFDDVICEFFELEQHRLEDARNIF
jgi:hypothetical protein